MDPRIPPIVDALLARHLPSKILSEIHPDIREAAQKEATILLEVLDSLRPPDIMVLANRHIERVSAWAKTEQLREVVQVLRQELQRVEQQQDGQFTHLRSGMYWAIETINSRFASTQ